MIRFIENIGDYFSQNFFDESFPGKVFSRSSFDQEHVKQLNKKLTPLREKYFKFKTELLVTKRTKDKVKLTHDFHTELLHVLDYINGAKQYDTPVCLNDNEVIPVRYRYYKGDKPYLFVMEMNAIVQQGDETPDGIYEQTYKMEDWESVFPADYKDYLFKPDVIKDALSELFILPEDERPQYVIMLAAPKVFLIQYERWKYDSFLLFDLEELFVESQLTANRDHLALFYALLAKPQFISSTDSVLTVLEEDAHKAAYGVTQSLKNGVIFAVESLANEAIYYKLKQATMPQQRDRIEAGMCSEQFARELKDDCLTFVYRLLFLFYAEAREDLQILPVKSTVYQKGYSLEMLRDLEMVALTTDSSRNGYFFSDSLWKLFRLLYQGLVGEKSFSMKRLDSPLFDNEKLTYLKDVRFRNTVLQQVVLKLSLSGRVAGKGRGRISYANLGINQLGSVYESLLAYSGFFATEPLIEIKPEKEKRTDTNTFLVPKSRRDDFEEDEICKLDDGSNHDIEIEKGRFVYRLNGRDRKNSASYYTPEVLTQTTVKYTLKGIIDRLKERQEQGEKCADEILKLKILEPAMGAAAFHNEVINQLSVVYLELKEKERIAAGYKRIDPGKYNDERQKVKAYLAGNNVYGVDLNPTAVELGRLSLWLNCMHQDMETPFFAHRLGTGNAVIGARLKVYNKKDFIVEYLNPLSRKDMVPKAWWNKAPQQLHWKNGKLDRKELQVYHFLLPDTNMLASAGISLLKKELSDAQKKRINEWRKEFRRPLTSDEFMRLQKMSLIIDVLLQQHYLDMKTIIEDTSSVYTIYGQASQQYHLKPYSEKERLAHSRNNRNAPYYKLKNVMDYWCSLWFWDARKVADLPSRSQWYTEISNILGVNLADIPDNASGADVQQILRDRATDQSTLFADTARMDYVQQLAENYRFFHNELEFIEVFRERGGFDVIVGNPPWIKLQFEEKDIITDKFPKIAIRKTTAPEVRKMQEDFLEDSIQKELYLAEYVGTESSAVFMNSLQNYPLLQGQQTNLYKCVVENGFGLLAPQGFMGLLHPETVYDDPNGQLLRKEIYQRLKYHFQFKNELMLFSEIDHHNMFSLNVYAGYKSFPDFLSINNLYHPSTVDGCFIHDGKGKLPCIKWKSDSGKMEWNIQPHRDRIVKFTESLLKVLAKTFEKSTDWESTKLVSIHICEFINVFEKLEKINTAEKLENKVTVCWDETNDVKDRNIERHTRYPDIAQYEMIFSGPHLHVSNPMYQSPRKNCTLNSDYDIIELDRIDEHYLPRTNYLPLDVTADYESIIPGLSTGKTDALGKPIYDNWLDYYKLGFRKMLSQDGERTLLGAILPPCSSHIHGVISIIFKDEKNLLKLTSITSSIILDFFIKTVGSANLADSRIQNFPLGLPSQYLPYLFSRTLMLNCVNKYYAPLWDRHWNEAYRNDCWSKNDPRLKPFETLTPQWQHSNPLRNWYERRMALVEIDVIVAMALGLSFEELMLIHDIQFPVLQQYEDDTWYDRDGKIVFTCSKGLTGVGLDRKGWLAATCEASPMQRTLKTGESLWHTISKSELYNGTQVEYLPPFDKCNRIEDYKTAWAHFEKLTGS